MDFLNGLKPVSLDHQRQKEMWAAIALVTNNWNEKKQNFKDLKQKEIASHQAYITYLANARLIFLAEIQKKQSIMHAFKQFILTQSAKQ